MPRPGPRPYECVRRAWHSDRHQPIRGSLIKEIFRFSPQPNSCKILFVVSQFIVFSFWGLEMCYYETFLCVYLCLIWGVSIKGRKRDS